MTGKNSNSGQPLISIWLGITLMKDRSSAESAVLTGLQVSGLVRGGGVRMWCWGGGGDSAVIVARCRGSWL